MASYRPLIALGLVAVSCLLPTLAGAQDASKSRTADRLFNDAIPLMESGDYQAAARKLEASYELDPAFATAMNLAACYEKTGKIASAWRRYRAAVRLARDSGQDELQQEARQAAAALKSDLPTLIVEVHSRTRRLDGLRVTRGEERVRSSEFTIPIYIDPGDHEIKAVAPEHKEFIVRITAVRGRSVTAMIPALKPVARTAPAVEPADDDPPPGDQTGDGGSSRRLVGWLGIGAGVAASGTALGFALSARSKWNDALAMGCSAEQDICPTPEGQALADSARSRVGTSTVMLGTGVALVAIGAYLVWTTDDHKTTRVVPAVGADRSAGLTLIGRF